jgi:hypothetical protein
VQKKDEAGASAGARDGAKAWAWARTGAVVLEAEKAAGGAPVALSFTAQVVIA